MKRNLVIISIILGVLAVFMTSASAQIRIKIPSIKIEKPEKETTKPVDSNTPETTNTTTTSNGDNRPNGGRTRGGDLLYPLVLPTNVPVLLKNSVDVGTVVHDEYWKAPNERNFSSWVPKIRFSQYYNGEKVLNYTVEYFNPNGSLWYSENLEASGRNADRTVLYQSPSPYSSGVLNTKSTNAAGVYGFKITSQDTKQVLFQGKFKVGKISRSYSAQDKNKFDFYVDHDWTLPFAMLGFHHAIDESGAMRPELSVWLKGPFEASELEGRIFYKGRQIVSTKDPNGGAAGVVEERASNFAAAFAPDKVWKRWQFTWNDFRVHNNGTFNPANFPRAHFADRNPGEYTVKIYRGETQIRELSFTVGADGRFVVPEYSKQVPLPYHRFLLPVRFVGGSEKWDAAVWKTESFYGNPLAGFAGQ